MWFLPWLAAYGRARRWLRTLYRNGGRDFYSLEAGPAGVGRRQNGTPQAILLSSRRASWDQFGCQNQPDMNLMQAAL